MRIGSLSPYGYNPINPYSAYSNAGAINADTAAGSVNAAQVAGAAGAVGGVEANEPSKPIVNPGQSTEVQPGKKSSPAECETCKNRKYVDGSDEMVSFKSPQHLSPTEAASRVASHEQEHVSNAYMKASQKNGKVVSCSVAIHTSVCPECGRTYVSGGTTNTSIRYANESNPYVRNMKSQHADAMTGQNMDFAV